MDRMQKARAKMLIKHPFFATLLMSTPAIEVPDEWFAARGIASPTMATDMEKLYWSRSFVDRIEDDDILFILAHEVMHIALVHGMRLQGRNPVLWNIAADYCINPILVDNGFNKPSDKAGGLFDDKYKDMSADQVYDDLVKRCDEARKKGGTGKPGDPKSGIPELGGHQDLVQPDGASDPAHEAKVRRGIQQKVAQAANVARMAGKLAGGLERLVGEILDPKVPWSHLLRDYMTRVTKDDEQWSRRNRRFQNVYLPARHSEKMGEIVLIGDTSGSIGNDELCKYMAEAVAIAEDVHPERIRILWADTRVAGEQVFEEGELIVPKPKGGGGTDMRVPILYAEKFDPEVVVLFTDGYSPFENYDPPYPLIVCCTTDTDVPIGQMVRI
jgi:predicted metal-dependent peptidase